MIPVKAAASDGSFYTDGLTNAYDYIIANKSTYNIRVVNMSLGGGIDSESEASGDDALLQKIDAANAAGILTVCAAGNTDSAHNPPYYEYPGDYATCLSVINLTSSGSRSSDSNYNTSDVSESSSNGTKDISAPGTSIYSTYKTSNSSYTYMNGTSMASPVVAGIAALVFAANDSLTPAQVKSILEETATDLGASGWDRTYGYGEVNALAAVQRAYATRSSSPALSVSTTTHEQDYGWQAAVTSTPTSVATSGTTGKAKRLEGIKITLGPTPYSGSINYCTHVQDIGWQDWVSDGALAGTTGRSKRLEAIRIKLTGDVANYYDVYYRVHAENVGWMDWASNGEEAGTAGYAYRLEAIQIVVVAKGRLRPAHRPRVPRTSISNR